MENLWSLGYTPSFPIPVHLFQLFPVLYRPFPIKHSSHHWLLQDQILPWLHSEFWLLYEEYSHLFSSHYSYIFMSLYFASQWENMFLKASNVSLCLLVFKIMPGSGLSNKVGIKKKSVDYLFNQNTISMILIYKWNVCTIWSLNHQNFVKDFNLKQTIDF